MGCSEVLALGGGCGPWLLEPRGSSARLLTEVGMSGVQNCFGSFAFKENTKINFGIGI